MDHRCEILYSKCSQEKSSKAKTHHHPRPYSIRILVAFLSLLGTAIMYITRVNLNVAILAMVSNEVPTTTAMIDKTEISSCASFAIVRDDNFTIQPKGEFDWSPPRQGIILGSFFYGYIATQIIGGRLAESYLSPSKLIFAALSLSGLINLATPFLVRTSLLFFILSRILLGAVQGVVYPAFYCLFFRWIPPHERSTYIPWLDGGVTIGTVLISALSGQIIVTFSKLGGWPVVFYFSGILALSWSIFWLLLVRSNPEEHSLISAEELSLINHGRINEDRIESVQPDWYSILSSPVFYAVLAPKISYGIVFDFITLKIPAYLQDVIHLPVNENGLALAVIMVGYALTLLSGGILADHFISRSSTSKCRVRKGFQLMAGVVMAVTLLLLPRIGCSKWANVLLLTGCMLGYGFTSGGDLPIVADISGPLSGTIFAAINTACSVSGIVVPYIVGVVIEPAPGDIFRWSSVMDACALIVLFGTGIFILGATSQTQSTWTKDHMFQLTLDSSTKNKEIAIHLTVSNDAKEKLIHSNAPYYHTFTPS